MLHSLDHVVVAVRELERASAETARLLGRTPAWRGEHPAAGTANTLFRFDNTYLELLAAQGEGPLGSAIQGFLDAQGEGLVALAFGTDDAEACRAELAERGIDTPEPAPGLGRDVESGGFRRWRNVFLPPPSTRGLQLFAIEHTEGELPPSLPLGDPAATASALDHVVVWSSALEESRALYGDRLGLRLALDRTFEARGIRILFFRVGGVTVEVVGRLQASAEAGEADRFGGLAWQVADVAAARERLGKDGFEVSEVRDGAKPGTEVCTVKSGTHGVPTLLIQPAER